MKRLVTTVVALVAVLVPVAPPVASAETYGWTISSSSTDPLVNADVAFPGNGRVYLWFYCSPGGGMAAAEFDLQFPGTEEDNILGTTLYNNFLNAADGDQLLLAVPFCPVGPVLALRWATTDLDLLASGQFCLVPSQVNGIAVVVDCSQTSPQQWPFNQIGYTWGGATPSCPQGSGCIVPVDATSWGSIKSLYR
jgi:hypothetical protein